MSMSMFMSMCVCVCLLTVASPWPHRGLLPARGGGIQVNAMTMTLMRLSLPTLLEEESFLMGNVTEVGATAVRQRVSQTIGLVNTPNGFLGLFAQTLGYL